jgi:hypothetical protein
MTRTLLYIPVIHGDKDLGRIGAVVEKRSAEICGKEHWEIHKRVVTRFWEAIEDYFKRLNAVGLKIYQDGLIAEGELGRKIIEQGAAEGSRNYQIVLDLIKRGGKIQETEDVALLRAEYERIMKLTKMRSPWERAKAQIADGFGGDPLLKKRDRFIASTINKTLMTGETGVLFGGAFHDVLSHLPDDIAREELKIREKVKDYFKLLVSGGDKEKFDRLARYLVQRPKAGDE